MFNFLKKSSVSTDLRQWYGGVATLVGVLSNTLLFGIKIFTGAVSGSISITADAFNNLTDSLSSIITLIGFKISARPADERHPYGYARFEYISGLVVASLVMVIGIQFLIDSIKKVLNPAPVEFTALSVVMLVISVIVKLFQAVFNKRIGIITDSVSLKATAADSLNDAVTTFSILLSVILSLLFNIYTDAYFGAGVSVFIILSGIKLVKDTLSLLIGSAPSDGLIEAVKARIKEYPAVLGFHDLILHTYGPEKIYASVHVEMPYEQDLMVSHDIVDEIERDFLNELGIFLVIHLDPVVTNDPIYDRIKDTIENLAADIDPVLTIHDFRISGGAAHKNLIFDMTVPPKYSVSNKELRRIFNQKASEKLGENYHCIITLDRSYTADGFRS